MKSPGDLKKNPVKLRLYLM